jgi:hypothetical protein
VNVNGKAVSECRGMPVSCEVGKTPKRADVTAP